MRMPNESLRNFVLQEGSTTRRRWTAVSLFSGAGLSDLGYEMAGFRFVVQVEIDPRRAAIGRDNFPTSRWLTFDVRDHVKKITGAYHERTSRQLDLLVATPPCQGMSSSNPSRGKRRTPKARALDKKNGLLLEVIPISLLLKPRIIVIENVRQVLTLEIHSEGTSATAVRLLSNRLPEYKFFSSIVNMADYGVPQIRRRALIVGIHNREPCLKSMITSDRYPVPAPTHAESPAHGLNQWVTIGEWLKSMEYEALDARSKDDARGTHPLHFVPAYGPERYRQINEIPANSGRSAYENDKCPSCGQEKIEIGLIACPKCGSVMRNRPYVERGGRPSLIKGFESSYRRMHPGRPAYTVTTNSSHIGSDFKIHPWENRVLSILECADLQTVPRFYDWGRARANRTFYLIRNLIGEAFPTYFTALHGQVLDHLLTRSESSMAGSPDSADRAAPLR